MTTILVVDDDHNICRITKLYLEKSGYKVFTAHDGEQALTQFGQLSPDLIVLDIMLPKRDGWSVCQMIRAQSDVPILMLTARGHVDERIEGLQMGADDYLVKPFDPNELVARVTTILRRTLLRAEAAAPAHIYEIGSLRVDVLSHDVTVEGQLVALPKKEYELLLFFVRNPNQVFTREDLIAKIWGWDFEGEDRVVDLYIKRLRQKLSALTERKVDWVIRTVWGVGYKFEGPDAC
ncbi:response regulator transcription factor [Paenibacillus alba]|uniref:Response regulator transcription factor n=1 Tax=Paenibacillus alba TaxID=1197127 RepID=A0ABU6G7B5_9BACL|nr:response regulator transcription factor [Paenibacillus alba]MEC0229167.1 response regulator transcription factor [Paenibacillus alba]NQX67902.1 response regulator transcription factor [Paenibacillus alba]